MKEIRIWKLYIDTTRRNAILQWISEIWVRDIWVSLRAKFWVLENRLRIHTLRHVNIWRRLIDWR